MYKLVNTDNVTNPRLSNGVEISPVATLEDEYGGRAHIWVDDHCYQLGQERTEAITSESEPETFVVPVTHIFPEAFQVMKALPDLIAA